ncbi:hypothetical protein MESS2_70011 [Mesorhizobium metallidurans STM 2683]|uniref:Uncharacterized protein n=1 Tax=Mesorhizobium metallidurans STM 2683 TaxID=1297569 RepID=M5ESW7_9HYPH|nr:hypothetical protein MESS2_70011 [Mesorhizobium metallidurans STM 2683]
MLQSSEFEGLSERRTTPDTEIEVGLDMVDVAQHQCAGAFGAAIFKRFQDLHMLAMAATRDAGTAVKRDHQRRTRHQFLHEALEDYVSRDRRQQQVKITRRLDLRSSRARAAFGNEAPFFFKLGFEGSDMRRRHAPGCGDRDAGLDEPARGKNLPRFLRRRIGDERAAIALGPHQSLEGKHLQCRARHGAADVEQGADLAFGQFGPRRQPAVDDGVAQLVADRLGAILVGTVGSRECLVGNIHGGKVPNPSSLNRVVWTRAKVNAMSEKIAYDFYRHRLQSPIICALHKGAASAGSRSER